MMAPLPHQLEGHSREIRRTTLHLGMPVFLNLSQRAVIFCIYLLYQNILLLPIWYHIGTE